MLEVDRGSETRAANELLVSFTPGASAAAKSSALSAIGARTIETIRTQAMEAAGDGELARITIGKGLSLEKAMEIVSKRPGVEFSEPNFEYTASFLSDDALYTNGSLWGMYGSQPSPYGNQYGSHAAAVWGSAQNYVGTTKVGVGVIDTGIDYKHPDLYKNIWLNQTEIPGALKSKLIDTDEDGLITFRDLNISSNAASVTDHNRNGYIDADDLLQDKRWIDRKDGNGISVNRGGTANGYVDDLVGWNFVHNNNKPLDDNRHGTHVAGTIGAYSDPIGPDVGVAGVNWNSQLVALKYLDSSGSGYTSNAIKAVDYFTNLSAAYKNLSPTMNFDFAVTNNSWGGGGFSQSLLDAIVRGAKGADKTSNTADDVLFIAAAGNGGTDRIGDNNETTPNWPSNYDTSRSGAGYDAVVAVAAIDQYGGLAPWSNYGETTVDLAAPGVGIWSTTPNGGWASLNGTSMATPHVAGAVALYSAYDPNASAALIRDRLFASANRTYANDDGVSVDYAALNYRTATEGRLDIYNFFNNYDLFV
jgi:subtilisin family serine protease